MSRIASLPPNDKKQLRACMLCCLIKSAAQFKSEGCDNCEEFLEMRGSTDRVLECTTNKYDGMIAMMNNEQSWVARWQRIEEKVRGVYAVRVFGRLPVDVEDELERKGISYRPGQGNGAAASTAVE
ncbi:Spt4/RpoE2 zinc finger-domain-containing protein [Syncephalastrum racemosum]|uniref:Transcription elongation factor SPT4 n=1 Tax=Syncephalastrum racemosum TaxID=13706 RepID=A0A1X2HIQ5_SYNRA|nr:Spt4/RpoE2 zinc finger-domain-containing protein [Syncephalastrum racemosum]